MSIESPIGELPENHTLRTGLPHKGLEHDIQEMKVEWERDEPFRCRDHDEHAISPSAAGLDASADASAPDPAPTGEGENGYFIQMGGVSLEELLIPETGPARFSAQPIVVDGSRQTSPVDRAGILDEAKQCVTRDRQLTHGAPEESFTLIAKLWSAYLGTEISPAEVTVLMGMLKMARAKTAPHNPDNWVDLAGYAACGGELALNRG